MEITKKTKAMYFAELREMVINHVNDVVEQDALLEFIDKEVAAIERRKDKARERAEKRKAKSDALTDKIYDILHYDYITVSDIMEQLEDEEDISANKVTSRLGKLVRAGKVEKERIKVSEDGSRRMGYRKTEETAA